METKNQFQYLEIQEWSKTHLNYFEEDEKYFFNEDKPFFNTLNYEKISHEALIGSNQFVGILKLPGNKDTPTILKIEPKTASKYMDLLRFAQKIKCNDDKSFFYYDINERVDVEDGNVFFEIIANLFIVELKKILQKGFYKEYVEKEDNLNFLKGKLQITKQITKNFIKPKFNCKYYDLTMDNFTNQMIIYSALKVTKFIHTHNDENKKLKSELLKYVDLMKDEITLKDVISPVDFKNIHLSRKNDYYEEIINFSKIIITESFFESTNKQKSRCCNFLIDMNVIFERVLFGLIQNIIKNSIYKASDQSYYHMTELIEGKKIKIIPDITLFENNKEFAVVDAKYKSKLGNSEYYQIITYSLALKLKENNLKYAILVNFEENFNETNLKANAKIKISKLKQDLGDIKLLQISLNLNNILNKNYIEILELELKKILLENIDEFQDSL
ncbi:MAG: McrC family protein [Candidatus Woesearchaeota archaeon]